LFDGGDVMGSGEIIGNQSVHWTVDHGSDRKLKIKENESRRPTAKDDHEVAVDTKTHGRDPKQVESFDVRLRFESKADARAQLEYALKRVEAAPANASFYLDFRVPATVNGRPRLDPDSDPRPDIGISW
jgi:hypothetical protein